jgi:hypothetical protein
MWVPPLAFQSMDAQSSDAVLLIEKSALTTCDEVAWFDFLWLRGAPLSPTDRWRKSLDLEDWLGDCLDTSSLLYWSLLYRSLSGEKPTLNGLTCMDSVCTGRGPSVSSFSRPPFWGSDYIAFWKSGKALSPTCCCLSSSCPWPWVQTWVTFHLFKPSQSQSSQQNGTVFSSDQQCSPPYFKSSLGFL